MNILVLFLTVAAIVVNLGFILWGPKRLLQYARQGRLSSSAVTKDIKPLVSVVIAARNEAHNLEKNLPQLLEQSYSPLELVLCNDGSTDNTAQLVASYAQHQASLQLINRPPTSNPGKKLALAEAINHAKGDWLLATDGDCRPATSLWAEKMMKARSPQTDIVLGYAPYLRQPGWLNRWIRFEALLTAVQYLSAATHGKPYMGVGRNLLYRKAVYTKAGGFSSHQHIVGGDDDLLINATATATNTAICIDPDTWVFSAPKQTWKAYIQQKRRHLSVGTSYKKKDQVWLGAFAASQVACFLGCIMLVLTGAFMVGISLFVFRLLVVWPRVRQVANLLGESDLVPHVALLDSGLAVYYIRFSLSALLPTRGKKQW